MSQVVVDGKKVRLNGNLPEIGSAAPDCQLVQTDLTDMRLSSLKGRMVVMNIFQSVDRLECAETVRQFNELSDSFDNTKVLCISKDLPFAHGRFNAAEGIDSVISLSEMRDSEFGDKFGLRIAEGPYAGLLARAIIIVDEEQRVIYTELVPDIGDEPDYAAASRAVTDAVTDVTMKADRTPAESEAPGVDYCITKPTGEHARLEDGDDCDESRAGKI